LAFPSIEALIWLIGQGGPDHADVYGGSLGGIKKPRFWRRMPAESRKPVPPEPGKSRQLKQFKPENLYMETNADSNEQQRRHEEETQKLTEAMKGCLQTALVGESQNFRSWVAASHRKFKDLQQLALITTALACLFSFLIVAASIWQAHRITRQATSQLQLAQNQATASADPFADLRRANWKPVGKLIGQNGRTFVELKAAQ
jgi:hypothetical protein